MLSDLDSEKNAEESDCGSGDELSSLFQIVSKSESIFYFVRITVTNELSESSRVCFEYSYNKKMTIVSSMVIDGVIDEGRHHSLLLSIGMCILPWYWMGFATPR